MSVAAKGRAFRGLLFLSLGVGIVSLVTLIVQVLVKGGSRLNETLIFHFPSSNPEIAGAQSAIFGTLWLMAVVAATCRRARPSTRRSSRSARR